MQPRILQWRTDTLAWLSRSSGSVSLSKGERKEFSFICICYFSVNWLMKWELDILTMPFNWLERFPAENSDFSWPASVVCVLLSGAKKERFSSHCTAKNRSVLCDPLAIAISVIQIKLIQENINSCFHASFSHAELGLRQLLPIFFVVIEYFIFTLVI